jgi:hypothetical protein
MTSDVVGAWGLALWSFRWRGVGVVSAKAFSRSRYGGWAPGQWAVRVMGVREGFFRRKAQRLDANGADVCEYLHRAGLQVKTCDLAVSTTAVRSLIL